MTRLVTELLDISRLETGRLVLRRQMVDVPEVAERVVAKIGMEQPDLDCTLDVHRRLPACLRRSRQGRAGAHQPGRERSQVREPQGDACQRQGRRRLVRVVGPRQGRGHPRGRPPVRLREVLPSRPWPSHGDRTRLWITRGLVEAHGGELVADVASWATARRSRSPSPPTRSRRSGVANERRGGGRVIADHDREHRAPRPHAAAAAPVADLDELRTLEAEVLGKRSPLSGLKQQLAALDADARREAGQRLNAARSSIEAALARSPRRSRGDERAGAARGRAAGPHRGAGAASRPGHLHLVTQAIEHARGRVRRHGLHRGRGPRGRDRLEQLRARSTSRAGPPGPRHVRHAVRATGASRARRVLRTHTSPVQIRVMTTQPPPIYTVVPGRVVPQRHRRRHAHARLPPDRGPGHRPGHHLRPTWPARSTRSPRRTSVATSGHGCAPRTSPSPSRRPSSTSVDPTAAGWSSAGCGMVHPNVFRNCGIDPEEWSGFAFGFGIDRLAMARVTASTTCASSFTNDIRFLSQF